MSCTVEQYEGCVPNVQTFSTLLRPHGNPLEFRYALRGDPSPYLAGGSREVSAILELREVSKDFATQRAVTGVSLQIPRGAFFSLLGPSGCGKTTVLRMVAGFETPSSGEVWLNGARVDHLPPYRRNVNTVFQSYALFPHLTVQENVAFGLRGASDAAARVARVLEQVRLEGKASRRPHELSGGERQRVALARAIVLQPDVLLLDEPLSALDPQLRKQVRGELRDLQRRIGVTFLFVTHDQEEALSLSDQIAVMHAGSVEQVGTPQEIYGRPRTRFVADFLGAMNWVNGAGFRPECVKLGSRGRRGSVRSVVYLGPVLHVELDLETGESITAQVAASAAFQPGQEVWVDWSPGDEVRFQK
jgi:ABC-type Fe3+/spermidine/putrescine transport system ATPase subunit